MHLLQTAYSWILLFYPMWRPLPFFLEPFGLLKINVIIKIVVCHFIIYFPGFMYFIPLLPLYCFIIFLKIHFLARLPSSTQDISDRSPCHSGLCRSGSCLCLWNGGVASDPIFPSLTLSSPRPRHGKRGNLQERKQGGEPWNGNS